MSVLKNLWTIWHRRLVYLNNTILLSLFRLGCLDNSIIGNKISSFATSKCESCCLGKSHVLPFPIHYSHATAHFDVIHTDVWGIAPQLSRMGYKCYVTFIDDQSRYTWIYFLRLKSDVFLYISKFS